MTLATLVTFAGFSWQSGQELIDAEVTLGSADKSNSCKVTLSDPDHKIAAAVINHAIASGGIQALPDTNKVSNEQTIPGIKAEAGGTVTAGSNTTGTVATGSDWTAEVKAFADTVVMRETPTATTDAAKSYKANNSIANGYFTDADILAGGGFPQSARTSQNVGRYQFNRGDWSDAKKANSEIKGYSPLDQDLVFLYKIKRIDRGYKELKAGDYKAALRKAANEWVSIPGGRQYQPQAEDKRIGADAVLERYYAYYLQRLAYYQKQSSGNVSTNTTSTTKPTTATPPKTEQSVKPADPAKTDTGSPVIKGSKLTVAIEGVAYEFLHQGTETSDNGTTILVGQGVRWIMSRRKRSATYKNVTLKQLAEKVAANHKIKLDYQATSNPEYEHIDQSGISDYKLLLRECEANGLLVTEDKKNLVIKERGQLTDSKLLLSRGSNLISYKITDKAMGSGDDEISKLLPQTTKTTIDPVSGKTQVVTRDVVGNNASTNSITGKAKPKTQGVLKSGAAVQTVAAAATKRIAGLPSVFVVPLIVENLLLAPVSVARTKGFPGVLDRIWLIKKITHKVAENTTTLELVSPVEVLDSGSNQAIPGAKPESGSSSKVPAGSEKGWVYPCDGIGTSPYGMRTHPVSGQYKMHSGQDIGAPLGTPIYAVKSGVISFVGDKGFGGGKEFHITHDATHKTKYLHNDTILVLVGQSVTQGQQVSRMGNTGIGTGSHLHFTLSENGTNINPSKYFPKMGRGRRMTAKEPT